VDGREVWRCVEDWALAATWDGPPLTCLVASGDGLMVGTAEAHVLRLSDPTLVLDESFDRLPERASWYTPWGGPPDTRSMAADADSVLVNIHVGGVARRDRSGPWRSLVDIDVDVHQIAVAPDGSLLAATGAAGFGRSTDAGATWEWDSDGLHGSYCRAVTVAGDEVLLTASTGPRGTQGAVYRRQLGRQGGWERISDLVKGNIDTFWLAASGETAAYVTQDGQLWASDDAGSTWDHVSDLTAAPRALALV
ncbi:MAG TPA: hypothetical protein VLL25_11245, partial [Acidimicrobiales bacterium]|nr:hypothetical protein [Acidimicrobiales bacterium]